VEITEPTSFEEIEDLFRNVAMTILGIPETDNKSVRMPYGTPLETGSAPGFTKSDNVCFIYVIPADDGYGQQRHITYEPSEDSDTLTLVDEHTDIFTIRFTIYGPKGYSWARKIANGLYRERVRKILREHDFYLKVGIPPIVQLNELREGDWFRRHDVAPMFYQAVRLEESDASDAVAPFEKVVIKLNDNESFEINTTH